MTEVGLSQSSLLQGKPTEVPAAPPRAKKVFLETWGCQMNVADSEAMLASLKDLDFSLTQSEEEADLVLLKYLPYS